jgi:hypothetical protein
MQSLVVAIVVALSLLAVLRGVWKQFSRQGAAGCGGCGSASGCAKPRDVPCRGAAMPETAQPVRWHRSGGAVSDFEQK